MKTRFLLLLIVAAIAGGAGYAIAHRFLCRPPASDLGRLRNVSHLAHALDLRPEQVEVMQSMQNRLCTQLADCCARHGACRRALSAALVAEPFDPAHARELWEALSRCYAESEMLAMEHIRSLRDILDTPQRARFDRMITTALADPGAASCEKRCGTLSRKLP